MFNYQELGSENQDNNQNWTQNNVIVRKLIYLSKNVIDIFDITLEINVMQFQKNVILNQKLTPRF